MHPDGWEIGGFFVRNQVREAGLQIFLVQRVEYVLDQVRRGVIANNQQRQRRNGLNVVYRDERLFGKESCYVFP